MATKSLFCSLLFLFLLLLERGSSLHVHRYRDCLQSHASIRHAIKDASENAGTPCVRKPITIARLSRLLGKYHTDIKREQGDNQEKVIKEAIEVDDNILPHSASSITKGTSQPKSLVLKLIHSDSISSPHYKPNEDTNNRAKRMIEHSMARLDLITERIHSYEDVENQD